MYNEINIVAVGFHLQQTSIKASDVLVGAEKRILEDI
jgi:hypothetical protein